MHRGEPNNRPDGALLIVSYEELSSHNGLNTRIKGIARELAAAGQRVEIAAPSYSGRKSEMPSHLAGIRVHTVPVPDLFSKWRIPIVTRALSVAFLTMCMVRRLRKSAGPFAWVQSEQVYPFLAACLLARKWKARVILDDPSLLGLFVEEKLRRRRVLRPLLKSAVERFETTLWRRADYILCSSQRTAGAIGKRVEGAKTKILRICNGVDLNEFTPGSSGGSGNRLFFNCSVPYYQNVAALRNFLKIVAHFEQKAFHNYSAIIAVNDAAALPPDAMHEIESNPRVRLLSNEKSLVPWLHESDLVLLPYEKGHLTTAGPRLKAFEAFACGKIVLGTREGFDEIPGCTDGQNVILCSDWLDMAGKTMGLITEGETPRKQRIRSEARTFAENEYSWQRLVKAYDPILNGR
jgi:glycosyltransferase involved in cell wall biosynthesis